MFPIAGLLIENMWGEKEENDREWIIWKYIASM
jgi:hypothetical protein